MENTNQTPDLGDFFGEARQGGDGPQWKMFTLSDREPNVYRIAPPIKSLKSAGRWSIYDSLHYGYTIPNEQNPDKPRHKPFKCVARKNRATGMLEQDCPECNLLESKEKEIEALLQQYISSGKSPDEAEEYVKPAKRLLREHNLDKKHYVLAKNLAGEWGVLKIPHRAKQALENVIDKYIKENGGAHPLAPSGGVWFRFTRKGKGLATEHYVEIESESLGGGRYQHKGGALTQLDVEGLQRCPDLATINDNKVISYDQVLALVRSGGDPATVAAVFGQPMRQQARQEYAPVAQAPAQAPVAAQPVAAPVQVIQPVQTPTGPSQADQIAALQAQLAALQAQKPVAAPTPAPAPVATAPASIPAPAPAPTAPPTNFSNLMNLDPQTFLSMFPDPNKK